MERRAASHTEEEEMNQRRRLLNLARKGDPKAINRLFELYQVRVYSGDNLKKLGRIPFFSPSPHAAGKGGAKNEHARRKAEAARRRFAARQPAKKKPGSKPTPKASTRKSAKKPTRRAAHR